METHGGEALILVLPSSWCSLYVDLSKLELGLYCVFLSTFFLLRSASSSLVVAKCCHVAREGQPYTGFPKGVPQGDPVERGGGGRGGVTLLFCWFRRRSWRSLGWWLFFCNRRCRWLGSCCFRVRYWSLGLFVPGVVNLVLESLRDEGFRNRQDWWVPFLLVGGGLRLVPSVWFFVFVIPISIVVRDFGWCRRSGQRWRSGLALPSGIPKPFRGLIGDRRGCDGCHSRSHDPFGNPDGAVSSDAPTSSPADCCQR